MGLDIFHAQAKREIDGDFCRVDTVLAKLKLLEPYVQLHENSHIDWVQLFADQGLDFGSYRTLSRATDGRYTCFAFVDANAVGLQAPVRVVFSDEWQIPLLPKFMHRSKLADPAARKAPHVFGPFATIMKSER